MTLKLIALSGMIILGGALKAQADERTYDLQGFDQIEVSSGVTVDVTVGPAFSVMGEALRGDIDRLDVDQHGDKLVISRRTSWGFFGGSKRDRFQVTVTLPDLQDIEGTSGATISVASATDALTHVASTSGATVSIQGALDDIALEATSGSTLRLSGTCAGLTAEASSGATLAAGDLDCATADLHSSSGSSLRAQATETAVLHASSGASLRLDGGAEVTSQKVSTGGSIRTN